MEGVEKYRRREGCLPVHPATYVKKNTLIDTKSRTNLVNEKKKSNRKYIRQHFECDIHAIILHFKTFV